MKFNNPTVLASRLYDKAVEPDMTPVQKIQLAMLAGTKASELWQEYS